VNKPEKSAEKLRLRAEQALRALHQNTPGNVGNSLELETIFQELQIHQIELEMQNDELRIVNEQLELQQLKFLSIYDLAPVAYFILNDAGFIQEVNSAGYNYFQVGGKAAILGKPLRNFVASDHSDEFYLFLTKIRNSGKHHSIQLKMASSIGQQFDAQLEGIVVRAIHNSPLQYYIAVIDISETINARHHLSEASQRLELALQTSGASIWELDITTMKFESEELSKFQNGTGHGFKEHYLSFLDMLHPEDRDNVDKHFRSAINMHHEVDILCRIMTGNETWKYYSLNGHSVAHNGAHKCFVGIMMDVTEREKMEAETLRLKHDQQKNIMLAMLDGQENARKRISYALHDSVSQLLYGIKMKLGIIPRNNNNGEFLDDINEMLNMAITETRNISFELAPSILTDFGLSTALDELAKRLSVPNMKIKTQFSGFNERLDTSLETGIFRIVQELINNCMKHSRASMISVEMKKNDGIIIVVKDNGTGFSLTDEKSMPTGAGLSSICNRVNLYNGSMHIDTAPGKGTTVRIKLPHEA
jgi:PAS domain S-box-containing protein